MRAHYHPNRVQQPFSHLQEGNQGLNRRRELVHQQQFQPNVRLNNFCGSRHFNFNASVPEIELPRPDMSGQYSFPPPPPPPGPPPANYGPQQHPQYGYAQPPQRSSAPRGGRGGIQGGRGDFHAVAPYQHNGYNGPPHGQGPQGPLQQGPLQSQGPVAPYDPHNPAPYLGPQAPGPQVPGHHGGPQGGYGGAQWQNNHHPHQHGPPQGPPQNGLQHGPQHGPQQPPPPQPLAPQNYHPNYAPQSYNQPPQQYGPQQPPQQFQHNQPPQYGPSQGLPPQQWQGPPQHSQQQFNTRGRGRGSFNSSRGGHEAPLMGPPIRMGFDNDGRDQMAQAGNGFPPQYSNHQSPTPVHFSQPAYQSYPPQGYGGQRPPLDQNPFPGAQRGRGNMNNFRGRGRGDFQFRGRDSRHHSNGARASSESYQKLAVADANGNNKKKKKRRTNTLGLTPNGADHEDSEDEVDDVDEEARLVTLLGPDTPQLPSDLNAWLYERKSRFPTKARREAAEEEHRKRREMGMQGKKKQDQPHQLELDQVKKEGEGETRLEKQQRKAEKLRRELEKAERKIQDAVSGSKRKRENGDEGDEEHDQVKRLETADSSGSDSDDSSPEAMTSRSNGLMRISQPPKAQLQRHCKYFSTGGTCGKKGKCRFVHDQEVRNQALKDKEANGGKMTLAQRLILNDTAKDDLTILKSIKYLKEKGLMRDVATDQSQDGSVKSEENGYQNMDY